MYCKKCGARIDDDSVFCQKCGAKQTAIPDNEQISGRSGDSKICWEEPAACAKSEPGSGAYARKSKKKLRNI